MTNAELKAKIAELKGKPMTGTTTEADIAKRLGGAVRATEEALKQAPAKAENFWLRFQLGYYERATRS